MPRKTKKQKIVADYRRKIAEISFQPSTPTTVRVKPASLPVTHIQPKKEVNEERLEAQKHIIVKDLRKTVLWSTVAITLEVVLYFVS